MQVSKQHKSTVFAGKQRGPIGRNTKKARQKICRAFGIVFRIVISLAQIAEQQLLQQLVPVDAGDEAAGAVIVGDIGGILGENITHKLIDGVIAFDQKGIEYRG